MPAILGDVARADRGELTKMIGQLEDKKGNRYTLAEPDGRFVCPVCTMPGLAVSARDLSLSPH
jgi:hypothetical protein